ncbi:MAG: hypothetical protein KGJ43_06280 [Acidobacteriota bacterium]|nr:hypothetical protein [Acidobacteriota bacterium]
MASAPILLVSMPFGEDLDAVAVGAQVGAGLSGGAGDWEVLERTPAEAAAALRGARALVLAGPGLCGAAGEAARGAAADVGAAADGERGGDALTALARDARQAGVPAYGVTGCADPDLFAARILDLQRLEHGRDRRSLRSAGRRLGETIRQGSRADA